MRLFITHFVVIVVNIIVIVIVVVVVVVVIIVIDVIDVIDDYVLFLGIDMFFILIQFDISLEIVINITIIGLVITNYLYTFVYYLLTYSHFLSRNTLVLI